ncbi:hypothetical protein LSAT2_004531, partial [Lamellibrachia satsuma]
LQVSHIQSDRDSVTVALDNLMTNIDMAANSQNRILCTNLTELVKKTLLSFCEINITFSSHLEIFGSVHVHADGDDVISFLLNEKCAKQMTGPKNVVHRRSWSDTMGIVKSQSVATEEFMNNAAVDDVACSKSDEDRVSSSASREHKGRTSPDVVTATSPPGSDRNHMNGLPDVRESRRTETEPDDDVEIIGAEMNDTRTSSSGDVATPTSGPVYSHAACDDVKATWQHSWVRPTHLIPNWSAVSGQPSNGEGYLTSTSTIPGVVGRVHGDPRRSSASMDYVPPAVTLQDEGLAQEQLISAAEVNSVLRSLAGDSDASCGSSLADLPPTAPLMRADIKQEPGDGQGQGQLTAQAYTADTETTIASHTATSGGAAAMSQAPWENAGGMWQPDGAGDGGAGDGGAGGDTASSVFKHPCFLCSLSFHSQLRLKMHLSRWHRQIINSPGGEVRCLICHKIFADSDAFSAHTDRCHYRCVACGKSFSSKQAHDLHFRADHQLVRYQCQICMVRFKTKDGFRCHMNAQHNRSRQYDCLTCGRRFYTRQALYSHKKQNHQ